MKQIYLWLFLLFCTFNIMAQSTANYAFSTNTTSSLALDANGSVVDMSAGTTQLLGSSIDDASSSLTNIGFNFTYMGIIYSQFGVSDNGLLTLGVVPVSDVYTIPNSTVPTISAFANDMKTGSNGKVEYKLVGASPNRTLVVQWTNNMIRYTTSNGLGTGTWQIRLYETSQAVEFVYGAMLTNTGSPSAYYVGFSVATTANKQVTLDTSTNLANTTATATTNTYTASSTISNLNSTVDGSRKAYTFIPPSTTTDPTTLTYTSIGATTLTLNWIDNSANELGFLVTRATDAAFTTGVVNATVASTTSVGTGTAYSLVQTGLSVSTIYYFKIQAFVEGGVSTGLTGSQSTIGPGTYTSIATGNWNNPATWDANVVPSSVDSVIIAPGHTVSINATGLSANNVTVNGILDYTTTPTSFTVNGNLTVASGGIVNVFFTTTGKTLIVTGNILNNGRINTSLGTLTLNGSTVQSVTGSGMFGGTVVATGTTNTADVIANLSFTNTATATPNIIWSFNNIKVATNLTMTTARINLGTNKMTFGNYAAGGTLSNTSLSGFLPGAKFSRWWTNAATGTSISAGTDPSTVASRYPFISNTGVSRVMYISRSSSTTTGNTAGELAVIYTDATTVTTGLSVADAAYTITDRFDGKWAVSTESSGYVYASGTHTLAIIANNAYNGNTVVNGNSRVMLLNSTVGGTHQNGTTTPGAQRIGLTTAQITAGALYIGVSNSDIVNASITNGDWNSAATWSKGVVPVCTDVVTIANGTTVTSNGAGNVAKNITIATTGALTVASNDLTVGCSLNNNFITNNGTLTVSGGTLNVNGNIANASTSTFNQSGGNINVDGNAAGVVASSVASATPLFSSTSTNINLTGGTLTIVDPHTATTNSNAYAIYYSASASTNSLATSSSHTTRFGNGVSIDAGGNTSGFYYNGWVGTGYLSLGNVIVSGPSGTNRNVVSVNPLFCNGNLDINSGGNLRTGTTILAGNFNVNSGGTFISTIDLRTGIVTANTSTNLTIVQATSAQTITNNGTISNLLTSPTANLTTLIINTSSTATLPTNISMSADLILGTTTSHIFPSGSNITVGGKVNVPTTASLTFSNNSNLIQGGTTNTNVGNITVKRNSNPLMLLDYVMWGSPVATQQLQAFSPNTLSNRFYSYNSATNTYSPETATANFANAKGYLIRMPNDHPTTATPWTASFVGVPNNGNYTFTPAIGFNSVANPYPSTMSMASFVTDNPTITGTLYFWRKTNNPDVTAGYCSWNNGTYVSNGQPGAITDAAGNDILQVGQGFIVKATATTGVLFKNTHRIANNDNQTYRSSVNATTLSNDEKNRVWLNLTSTEGNFSQTAFGYMTNATNEVDSYDGESFNGGTISISSLIADQKFVIQGKALPFENTDLVPLNYKVSQAGSYTIAIDNVDGLFANNGQTVYLRDLLLNTETNLSAGAYTFASATGEFNNRFVVAYTPQTLGTPQFNSNSLIVYKNNNNVVVNSGTVAMESVKVFDLTGRLLVERNNINATSINISVNAKNQVILVQVKDINGNVVSKKVIN